MKSTLNGTFGTAVLCVVALGSLCPAQPAPEGAAGVPGAGAGAAPSAAQNPAAGPREVLPIVEVMVYEDRALVTREGEVALQAGGRPETIVVGGLPPTLTETSLRAGLVDAARGRVISVSSEVERQREIQDTKLRAVEEEKRAAGRKVLEVDDDLAAIGAREAYLDAYEKLVLKALSERTGGGGDEKTDRWAEALKFIRDGRTAAQTARREAERKRADLARVHSDLEAEAARLRRPEERSTRTAEVTVEAAGAGRTRLRVSYVIEGAAWSPRYDARYDPEKGDLAVTYFGEVRQRTGEDWQGVRLVLSTARPSVGARRPEVLPLRLASAAIEGGAKGKGIAEREVAVAAAPPRGFVIRTDTTAGAPPTPAETPPADPFLATDSRENATSATFYVPGQAAIPADGRPHKVPVAGFRERAETSFETAPRLQRFVYLKAAARNGSPYPMLAGPVDIFRSSGFIGTSSLKFVAPGRPFEVSLGIEESLKVRRAVTADAVNEKGREKRQGFDIEVANFGDRPQAVTVIENYPVADIEEVQVKLDSSTTAPTSRDEKEGIVRWRLEVPAGGAKTVHLEYTIHYPRDYRVE